MNVKHIFSVLASVCIITTAGSCAGQKGAESGTAATASVTAETTQTAAETAAPAVTTATPVTEQTTDNEPKENTFGKSLDVYDPILIPVDDITDEALFGHEDIVTLLKNKCYDEHTEAISALNKIYETQILSADDIRFVRGHVFDLDKDGCDDLAVNLAYNPNTSDYSYVVGCVLYYVDGQSGDVSEIISGGIMPDGTDSFQKGANGSEHDRIEELWDCGEFMILKERTGFTPLSSGVNLIKTVNGSSFEIIGSATDIQSPRNGVLTRLDHASLGYQYLPAVIDVNGEYKKLGFEQISVDDFYALFSFDEQLASDYSKSAESTFGSDAPECIDRVYTCGYQYFMIYCKPEYAKPDWIDYIYLSPLPTDYPPVIIDTEPIDGLLYGVNLNKLHIINGQR